MQNTPFHLVSVQWWSVTFEELSQSKTGDLFLQTSCCCHGFNMLARRKMAERDFAQLHLMELPPLLVCAHCACTLYQCWAWSGIHFLRKSPVLQIVDVSVSVTFKKIGWVSCWQHLICDRSSGVWLAGIIELSALPGTTFLRYYRRIMLSSWKRLHDLNFLSIPNVMFINWSQWLLQLRFSHEQLLS